MDTLLADGKTRRPSQTIAWLLAGPIVALSGAAGFCQAPAITISPDVPHELNDSGGGAPNATPEQAAAFAWQEFIALNWPAGPAQGPIAKRDTPSATCLFGQTSPNCGVLVWETLRGKVEIFPGDNKPPHGYQGSNAASSWGYDDPPAYKYSVDVPPCGPAPAGGQTPWINLDETDQITLDSMYAGVAGADSSPGNSAPNLIRFLAKANRAEYVYVAKNSDPNAQFPDSPWWKSIPGSVVQKTKDFLTSNQASPPQDSSDVISLPNETIEMKAGWRPLNPEEMNSGQFHTQTVRYYEHGAGQGMDSFCYRDATWGLIALHIIQKTTSAPYFIYATFEQYNNILTADGGSVEDVDGNLLQPSPAAATTPQVCLVDEQPKSGKETAHVILTTDPETCAPAPDAAYCDSPGKRLYYRNENRGMAAPPPAPLCGNICVNRRDNEIPQYVIDANRQAHAAIHAYLDEQGITSAPWPFYKLVNVQYFPYDKVVQAEPAKPNGSLYTTRPPYSAKNPSPSSFYQANIVVETNRALQLFSGGLTVSGSGVNSDWNYMDGSPHKNTYYAGHFYNAGGCLGCHGSQGQTPFLKNQVGDFSVILARGAVGDPEYPAQPMSCGMTVVPRNRSLILQ